jgi:Rne/Rng family ribonuclease
MDILIDEMEGGLWVGAARDRRLHALEIDPAEEWVRAGAIYRAKVVRINTRLNAAFVDLDGINHGMLNLGDVMRKNRDTPKADAVGKVLQPGDSVLVQAKDGVIPQGLDDDAPPPEAGKAPRVSMYLALPGRFLVYMPRESGNKISSRIRDKDLRARLKTMLDELNAYKGCILRAAAANVQTDVLLREADILNEMWLQIAADNMGSAPQQLAEGPGALQRVLGDTAASNIQSLKIVTYEQYEDAEDFCSVFAPDLVPRIEPVELADPFADLALFIYHELMSELRQLRRPAVPLPGGGRIIIESTTAMTTIDVDRADDSHSNLSIMLEAAEEIARQLRLRNLGGAVLVDALRLKSGKQRTQVINAFSEAVQYDACTVQVHGFTNTGMLELTRERRAPPMAQRLPEGFADF